MQHSQSGSQAKLIAHSCLIRLLGTYSSSVTSCVFKHYYLLYPCFIMTCSGIEQKNHYISLLFQNLSKCKTSVWRSYSSWDDFVFYEDSGFLLWILCCHMLNYWECLLPSSDLMHGITWALCVGQGLQLILLWGPNEDLWNNLGLYFDYPWGALWCWRNNIGTWTLLETAFTPYFLQKVSWVIGKSFQVVCTFIWNERVHLLAKHLQTFVNKPNVNINYLKIAKKHCGLHKMPWQATCGRHVWDFRCRTNHIHESLLCGTVLGKVLGLGLDVQLHKVISDHVNPVTVRGPTTSLIITRHCTIEVMQDGYYGGKQRAVTWGVVKDMYYCVRNMLPPMVINTLRASLRYIRTWISA